MECISLPIESQPKSIDISGIHSFFSHLSDQIDGKFSFCSFFLSFSNIPWFVLTESSKLSNLHLMQDVSLKTYACWNRCVSSANAITIWIHWFKDKSGSHKSLRKKKSHIIGELFKCLALAVLLSFGEQRFRISIYSQQKQKLWWNTPMPIQFTPPALNGLTVMPMRIIWHLLKNFLIAFFSLTKSNTRTRDFAMYFYAFFPEIEIILPS